MAGEASEVGSIIGYLVLNRADWTAGVAATERDAARLSRLDPNIRIQTNAVAVVAQLGAVDTAAKSVGTSSGNSSRGVGLLLTSILALGPAAIPLAGALTGAFAGAIPTVLTLALGVKGLTDAEENGTLQTTAFGKELAIAQGNLQTLEQTAAGGVMTGFASGLHDVNAEMPFVNRDVGALATQIGNISGHVGPGLVALLVKLDPLFTTIGDDLEDGSTGFQHWAEGSQSVGRFVAYVQTNLPAVEATLGNLINTGSHLVMALSPFGSTVLLGLRLFSAAINGIPIGVLEVVAPLLTGVVVGFKVYSGVTSLLASVNGALEKHQAVVAQTAAQVATAEAEKSAAALESARTREALVAGVSASLEHEAAVATAAAEQEAAAAATAAGATETRLAGLGGAAAASSAGLTSMIAPIAAVGLGLVGMTLLMGHHQAAAIKDAEAVNRLTESLKNGTGALQVMQELRTAGAVSAATALGIDPQQLQLAVTKQGESLTFVQNKLVTLREEQAAAAATAAGAANAYGKLSQGLHLTADEEARYGSTLGAVKQTQVTAQAETDKLAGRTRDLQGSLATVTREYDEARKKAAAFASDSGDAQLAASVMNGTIDAQAAALHLSTDQFFAARTQLDKWIDSQRQSVIQSAFQHGALRAVGSEILGEVVPGLNQGSIAAGKFDDALQQFAQSAGTVADRAKLVGAGLVAMQGDALGLAAAAADATAANDSLTGAFRQQAEQLASQNDEQARAADAVDRASHSSDSAAARVTAAEARVAQVRSNHKSTAAQLASAEASLTSARNSATNAVSSLGDAESKAAAGGALAYAETERAALAFTGVGKNLKASIDTTKQGAAPLISQLQAMQDAAEKEAEITYQNVFAHDKNTDSQKRAADAAKAAADVFRNETFGALVKDADQLGLTDEQATALATTYFNMPKDFSTKAQLLGTKDVVDVLDRIGQLLANLTGQTWTSTLDLDTTEFDAKAAIASAKLNALITTRVAASGTAGGGYRGTGGVQGASAGGGTVGGSGGPKSDSVLAMLPNGGLWRLSPGEEVIQNPQAGMFRPLLKAINSGQLRGVAMPAGATRGGDGAAGGQRIVVQGDYVNQYYNPVPEPASVSGPAGERRAFNALDGLG